MFRFSRRRNFFLAVCFFSDKFVTVCLFFSCVLCVADSKQICEGIRIAFLELLSVFFLCNKAGMSIIAGNYAEFFQRVNCTACINILFSHRRIYDYVINGNAAFFNSFHNQFSDCFCILQCTHIVRHFMLESNFFQMSNIITGNENLFIVFAFHNTHAFQLNHNIACLL